MFLPSCHLFPLEVFSCCTPPPHLLLSLSHTPLSFSPFLFLYLLADRGIVEYTGIPQASLCQPSYILLIRFHEQQGQISPNAIAIFSTFVLQAPPEPLSPSLAHPSLLFFRSISLLPHAFVGSPLAHILAMGPSRNTQCPSAARPCRL